MANHIFFSKLFTKTVYSFNNNVASYINMDFYIYVLFDLFPPQKRALLKFTVLKLFSFSLTFSCFLCKNRRKV